MITLFTGVPGAGKTLRTVQEIANLRRTRDGESRPIFANIAGLADELGCAVLEEPRRWFELPEGALIVIDECQRVFPPRAAAAAVPDYVQLFDTHRHKGYDIFLITQHPRLIDSFIRNLVGRHLHLYRPFGLMRSQVYEWQECCENPRVDAKPVPRPWKFPRKLFGLYRSAEQHTHTRRLPWRAIATIVACLAVAGGGLAYGLGRYSKFTGAGDFAQQQMGNEPVAAPIYEEASAPAGGGPAAVPSLPAAASALPVLEYHGWSTFRGRTEFLLCLPRASPAAGGLMQNQPEPSGSGCVTELSWSQVVHYRTEGASVIIMSSSTGPDLYRINDPEFLLDLATQSGTPLRPTAGL